MLELQCRLLIAECAAKDAVPSAAVTLDHIASLADKALNYAVEPGALQPDQCDLLSRQTFEVCCC